jgi:glycosyltransferase involved in cell wall biosynthesis
MVELSVVVSTFNRSEMLMRCLDALETQTLERARYEILVVDDHSPDDTTERMTERANRSGNEYVRFFRQPENRGPGAARNVGIRNAKGKWILFLDDDILVQRETLGLHLAAHAENSDPRVAIMGWTRVAPQVEITPLMRYLLESNKTPLVEPATFSTPDNVPFEHFQTNTSLSRDFMLRHGMFDEDIPYAYGDDTELAYRLHLHGLVLVFRQDISVDHYGSFSYRYARRRAHLAGQTAIRMHQKHPEWIDIGFLNYSRKSRIAIKGKRLLASSILDPLLLTADERAWDHPALARACVFSLDVHQLGAMLDTARAENLVKG